MTVRVGVIGYGYWGPNLVRNFASAQGGRLVALADQRREKLEQAARQHNGLKTFTDANEMIRSNEIDAVAIATPVSTHYPLALEALRNGKHVFVEKPLASTSAEVEHLMEEADKRGLVLMVDHTFVYTGAVRKIKELIDSESLGSLYYYDSVRVNLGLFQHDVNVIWDLAVHDLSIMDYLLPYKPCAVSASGFKHFKGQHENIAYITLYFDEGVIAHLHVNWLAPVKVRQVLIGGSKRMIVFNDLDPSEKVKVYDKGVTVDGDAGPQAPAYRTGDMWAPNFDQTEALRSATNHYIDCIVSKKQPLTDGACGRRVVRLLEAATESMLNRSKLIELNAPAGTVAG